jgi:hypothetical protein
MGSEKDASGFEYMFELEDPLKNRVRSLVDFNGRHILTYHFELK